MQELPKEDPKNEHYTVGSDCFTTIEMYLSFLHFLLDFYMVHYEEVRCMKFPDRVYFCHYGIVWNMQQFSWYEEPVNFPINYLYILFKSCQMVLGSRKEQQLIWKQLLLRTSGFILLYPTLFKEQWKKNQYNLWKKI